MHRTPLALPFAVFLSVVSCQGEPHIYTEEDTCREWGEKVAKDAASNSDAPPFITVACRGRGYTAPESDAGTD